MTTIKLKRTWTVGKDLGGGGFGRVFFASAPDMPEAAIKLIPKRPGAKRELLFETLVGVPNIIPIIDSGETTDDWVLVMPKAERSLKDHLESSGALGADAAVAVLKDMAEALAALEEKVVHRDIKPANTLLYQGHWCISDFGIARYVESATSDETLKGAMTSAYAAPERWRNERAIHASDIYSLGILAFELVSGRRPFLGPQKSDFREQHLHQDPPPVGNCPTALATLVGEMLFKASGARPTAANVLARLSTVLRKPSGGTASLQEAQRAVIEKQTKESRAHSAAQSESERRRDLCAAARTSLESIFQEMATQIAEAAPASGVNFPFNLNGARLELSMMSESPSQHPGSLIDIVAWAAINLTFPQNYQGYSGRSHSLLFCDAQKRGEYRWFETSFMFNPLMQRIPTNDPFALSPSYAAIILSPVMGEYQLAWPFIAIDKGEHQEFVERWIGWFGEAANGRLRHPHQMPERNPQGSYRTS